MLSIWTHSWYLHCCGQECSHPPPTCKHGRRRGLGAAAQCRRGGADMYKAVKKMRGTRRRVVTCMLRRSMSLAERPSSAWAQLASGLQIGTTLPLPLPLLLPLPLPKWLCCQKTLVWPCFNQKEYIYDIYILHILCTLWFIIYTSTCITYKYIHICIYIYITDVYNLCTYICLSQKG